MTNEALEAMKRYVKFLEEHGFPVKRVPAKKRNEVK